MGMCRAPPPSRPTITLSPRAWMATALPPCPIWVAPQPSSMAQLPTHPMPVSRCVSRVLYVSLTELSIMQRGQLGRATWSSPLPHSLLPSNLSTILSSSDLCILTFYKSSHMMPFQEPTLVVRWKWGCHPPLVALTKAPGYIHVLSMSQHSHL